MRILWKAINGREFIVEADNMQQAKEKIEQLRKEHSIDQIDTMVAYGDVDSKGCDAIGEEFSDDIQEKLHKAAADTLSKPDPKKQN